MFVFKMKVSIQIQGLVREYPERKIIKAIQFNFHFNSAVGYYIVIPPSTLMVAPLIYLAPSDDKKA